MEARLREGACAQASRCGRVVAEALVCPGVFRFKQLVEVGHVRALRGTESEAVGRLMEAFAYRDYAHVKRSEELWNLIQRMDPAAMWKLKALSVVSLATQVKHVSYGVILSHVDLDSDTLVEDLFLYCIDNRLLDARLNPEQRMVRILWSSGRDIDAAALARIASQITTFQDQCTHEHAALLHDIHQLQSMRPPGIPDPTSEQFAAETAAALQSEVCGLSQ